MPGAGTRTDITNSNPAARCLDLTRLISRVGRGPLTGVDRVEFAYLDHLLRARLPLFGLVQTRFGLVLLGPDGMEGMAARLRGDVAWGPPDLIGRLRRRMNPEKRRAEADLRRLSIARCRPRRLGAMLARHLPAGTAYLNVGHSNLTPDGLAAWRAVPQARVAVMIHDTIPLDRPDLQRPGMAQVFEWKLRAVARQADLILCNSEQTRRDVERWIYLYGIEPPRFVVAHLGVARPVPDPAAIPPDLDLSRPWFVTLGTIEPRKNHALLLDIWEQLAAERSASQMPQLFILGSRGWRNKDVFARLDSSPVMGRHVFERAGLSDGAVAALMQGAAAVLFPSRAEGYGLPPAEAAALGAPVICANLPVYDEILGNIPVYAESDDVYLWKQSIERLADAERAGQTAETPYRDIPTWADHFNLVLKVT